MESSSRSSARPAVARPGTAIEGPAVIEEKTSTTVLYPDQRAVVDAYLNIEVEI
jgi:N-methylhydantoinase A/oxoprolinase/acetone carboxylase beta subunit